MLLTDLAKEVAEELGDERFGNQSHYDRNTYYNGCRGPLCRKAERDNAARKRLRTHPDSKPRAKRPEAIARDAYLNQVLSLLQKSPLTEVEAG